tara:strand:+ start:247 stop:585 length:339 start_codon:yes stop_codon:yes gene_type:complete
MSVQPGTYNFTLQRRADYSIALQFKDSNDDAINITGYTVAAQIWDQNRTKKYADFTVTYTNRVNGQVSIALTDTQTSALPDVAYYDVLLTDGSGIKNYYLQGKITVSQGYTL